MRTLQIRRVILLGRVSRYRDGETIMQRGEQGDAMYVLLTGKVAIDSSKPGDPGHKISVAAVGDVFGMAAIMCGKPRVATATAIGPVEVLALNWDRLQRIARLFPRCAYCLFRNLSAITGERLANHELEPGTAEQA